MIFRGHSNVMQANFNLKLSSKSIIVPVLILVEERLDESRKFRIKSRINLGEGINHIARNTTTKDPHTLDLPIV